ncbi:MAG TPA: signal peptidase II [Terriglobales bacterium]|nr:signal peptidase II [Terriglobales bacterium]
MQSAHVMRRYLLLAALGVFLLDQATKWLILRNIPLHESVPVIPGLFQLTHVQNRGAAFGLFSDSPSQWATSTLILFSLIALAVVWRLLWKNSHALTATGIALALVLGGALGNLWDRLVDGHVVDYLDVYVGTYHWPAFNVADSAIVIGAVILVGHILFSKGHIEGKPVAGRS